MEQDNGRRIHDVVRPAPKPHPRQKSSNKLAWIFGFIALIAIAVAIVIGVLFFTKDPANKAPATPSPAVQTDLKAAQNVATFPLYYPSKTPTDYAYTPNSVKSGPSVVNYSYTIPEGTLFVTEQPKPVLTEEVNKEVDFKTSIGSAYIADLAGRKVGFIKSDKTMLIFSPTGKIDLLQLREFMSNMQPVQ